MTTLTRDAIFISHTNPEDNEFTVWLGARLTAVGPQPAFAPRPNARPEAPNHPPRLPTPVHEETSTLSALAHHYTPGESHQPSTRSG